MNTTTSSMRISAAFKSLKAISFFPVLFILLFLINGQLIKAQHLWYNDPQNGDIIMNEVMVTNTTPCSYWETMGWNAGGQGGAYCGIQQGSKGPNFIFSIWDPQGTSTPITAPYQLPNSNVTKFGGEGTGLHYDDAALIGWKLNTWVRTVSRRWDYNGHSYFGFWSYDSGTNNWTHHVTMDFPVASVQFNNSRTNSFLEDWCSSPQNYRKGLYKNGYKRASGQWIPWNTASYSGNGSSPGDAKANAGVENGAFFMEFGGTTSKKVSEGQKLTIPLSAAPVLTIGQLISTAVNYKPDSLKVSWVTDKTKSPQFSYTIKLINSTGNVVMTKTDRVPHLRTLTFSVKNVPSGIYNVSVSMLDIFDQQSAELVKTIVIGTNTNINDQQATAFSDFTIYPNPCKDMISFSFNATEHPHALLFIYDLTGHVVWSTVFLTADHPMLDISDQPNGIYFIKVCDQNTNEMRYLKLVKEDGF
jgi:hypothetical protein